MSTLYTGDSRFVLSGSDDGNVRIWKAHASDKLGIITARERAAIEYRETLKSRWKADAEINKIARYVSLPSLILLSLSRFLTLCTRLYLALHVELATYRSQYTRPRSSSGQCSMRRASRKSAAGSTRVRARASRRRRGRRWSLPSRHSWCEVPLFTSSRKPRPFRRSQVFDLLR